MSFHGGTRPHLAGYRRDSYVTASTLDSGQVPTRPIIDCSLGHNPLGHSQRAEEAIRRANLSEIATYPEAFFDRTLKPAILTRFAGAGLRKDQIFFGHGSFNIAERLIHKLIEPSTMLGYGPQFNEIPSEMVAAGGKYVPVPMTPDFRFPRDELIRRLREDAFSVVYLDNPNNPTGQLVELADVADIVEAAQRRGVIALVDEAYGDFVDDSCSCFNILGRYSNLVVIRSCSKGLGLAGLRVGYAAMSDSLAEIYRELDLPFEPAWLSALAAEAALGDNDFISTTREVIGGIKSILTSGLGRSGIVILPTHPRVSIFVAHTPNRNLFQVLTAQGIFSEPGSSYRQTYEPFDDTFVRLRVPPSEEITRDLLGRVRGAL